MIICKRLDPLDDHLQKAGPSVYAFARCAFITRVTGVIRGDRTEGGEEGKGEGEEIPAHGRSDGPKNNNMEIVPHNNHNTRPKQMTLNKLFILTYAPTM